MAKEKRSTVDELRNVLSCEAEGYQQMVDLAHREQTALMDENLADLAATVQDKENLLVKLKRWENLREQLVARLAQELNFPVNITISDLIERLDDTIAQQLSVLQQEFAGLLEQLLKLNHGNRMILQTGLVRIDATFDYLTTLAVQAGEYGSYTPPGANQGQVQTATGNVLNWEA